MKVFVVGGTGFLGTRLVTRLIEQGHEVTVLTRRIEKTPALEKLGIKAVVGDLLRPESFISGLSPQDSVVFVAMPEVRPVRMAGKQFRVLRENTTTTLSTVITIGEKLDCPLILTLGTSFRTKGDEIADESWPIERFGMTRIGEFVDPLIAEAMQKGHPPLIQMIPGQIYGPGGLFKNLMYEWMRKGKYRVIGSGDNYIPRIHVEDCAQAYLRVLEKMPVGERFIIADDDPCTQREFADFMANCMNVPGPKSVPGFIVKLVMGGLIYETITMNCLVNNDKAKKDLDWKLKYPSYREGLPAAIKEIESNKG